MISCRRAALVVLSLVGLSCARADSSDAAADKSVVSARVAAPSGARAFEASQTMSAPMVASAPAADADQGTTLAADPSATAASVAPAMIIRTGVASVQVDSLEIALASLRQLAARVGGYVANTSQQSGKDQQRTATIELKIPSGRYPDAVSGLAPLGRVESVTETAEDVGEQFVDVEARVANAHRLEARIVDLLARRTGKLDEVLQVEHELARVREEIERYEGHMRFLRTRAAVSTLTITVHERLLVVARAEGRSPISNAVREAWRNFVGFVAAFISMLGVLVPLALLGWLAWWLIMRLLPRGGRRGGAEGNA